MHHIHTGEQEEYRVGLRDIEERFTPLVLKCKELGRAMRIGERCLLYVLICTNKPRFNV
jgi:hypothetical protein